jgi:tripartite-type tricarboxylate transporter receptor subunit TctC
MKLSRHKFLHLAAGAAALPSVSRFAWAQAYPTRPVTIIVAFAAGGTTDITARIVGEHMSRTLGQPVVVENVVGAGGTIGSIRAVRAKPDGYTIELGHSGTHAFAAALYPKLAYRPDADFQPIGEVSMTPVLIIARKDFPPKNLKEFISFVKTNDSKLNVAHSGVGSVFFAACLLLNELLNVKPTLVPFTGGSSSINALLGGQVVYIFPIVFRTCEPARSKLMRLVRTSAIRFCRRYLHPRKLAFRSSRYLSGWAYLPPKPRRSRFLIS